VESNRSWTDMQLASRSRAWDCGRLFAGIVGSDRARGIDVCLL